GITSFAEGLSIDELRGRLTRAADEAVEAALPDNDDDGPTWSVWAMQGLRARDRAESAVCALERLKALGRQEVASVLERLKAALQKLDVDMKSRAAALTALNASRRAERDLLDDEVKVSAWWFSLRSEAADDGLVKALGGDGELKAPFSDVS